MILIERFNKKMFLFFFFRFKINTRIMNECPYAIVALRQKIIVYILLKKIFIYIYIVVYCLQYIVL